jgi:PmbA protein
MTMELSDLAASILERSGSGEHLEVYVARGRDAEVRVYEGAVESLTAATSAGVGIRVLTESPDGMREGFAWAGSLDAGVITDTLAAARDNARFATPDPHVALATPDGVAVADVVTYDPSISSVSTEEKIAFVTELERLVRQHPKVKGISSSDYSDGEVEMALASTNGIAVSSRRSVASAAVDVIAEDGDEIQTGYSYTAGRSFAQLELEATAADAVRRAVSLLGATKPTSRHCTVVLDPRVVAQLLSIVAAALSGEAVVKGRSFFAGRIGEMVAAPGFTLVDDPTNPLAYGAARVDGEGLACRRNELIVNGQLQRFYYDTVAARRAGTSSTGSALRGGFAGTPGPGCRALALQPGTMSKDEILSAVGDGIYVQAISGVHSGVSPVSGDFSVGAEGFLISDGALGAPIREATIASTLQKMLADVVAVGRDVEWLPGSAAGQSVAIANMSLSGV